MCASDALSRPQVLPLPLPPRRGRVADGGRTYSILYVYVCMCVYIYIYIYAHSMLISMYYT